MAESGLNIGAASGATSAGTIVLDIEASEKQFLKQVSALALKGGEIMQDAISKGWQMPSLDMSGITKQIDGVNARLESARAKMVEMQERLNMSIPGSDHAAAIRDQAAAIDFMSDKLQESMEQAGVQGMDTVKNNIASMTMPKLKVEFSKQDYENQLATTVAQLDNVNARLESARAKMVEMQERLNMSIPGSDHAAGIADDLLKAEQAYIRMQQESDGLAAKTRTLEQTIDMMGVQTIPAMEIATQRVNTELSKIGTVGTKAVQAVDKGMANATKSVEEYTKSTDRASRGTNKLMRYGLALFGIRGVYAAIRRVVNMVADGLKDAARQNSVFAAEMNGLSRATSMLKASFSSMIAPLVRAAIPAIQALIDIVTRAMNAVARFFALLTGQKTYLKVVDSTSTFVDNLNGAAGAAGAANAANQKLLRTLASFDDIELIPTTHADTGGGGGPGGGGGTAGPVFEEVSTGLGDLESLFGNLMDRLANSATWQKIAQAAETAWNNIKSSAERAWAGIERAWQDALPRFEAVLADLLPRMAELGGNLASYLYFPMISGALGAGLEIGGKLIEGILGVSASIAEAGAAILAPFINSLNNFWDEHGPEISSRIYGTWEVIRDGVIGVLDGIQVVFETVFGGIRDWWIENGAVVEATLTTGWNNIWIVLSGIWTALDEVARAVFGGLRDFFYEIAPQISEVIVGAWDLIWSILGPLWLLITEFAKQVWLGLTTWWKENGDNMMKATATIWDGIKGAIGGALDWISGTIEFITGIISGDWDKMNTGMQKASDGMWKAMEGIWNIGVGALALILGVFGVDTETFVEDMKGTFNGLTEFLLGVFTADWNRAWNGLQGAVDSLSDAIVAALQAPIQALNELIGLINQALSYFSVDTSWATGNGPSGDPITPLRDPIKENTPYYSYGVTGGWATGGVITQPTVGLVGEDGAEAIMPLERNTGWIRQLAADIADINGGGGGGETHVTMPIYLGTDTLVDALEYVIDREGRIRNSPVFNS